MSNPFDPADYVHAPIITVSTGITRAFALVDACPKDGPANVKKAAKHLKTVATKARDDLAERNRLAGTFSDEDSRILDNETDRAWGGLRMSIQAMATLSPALAKKATRAAELKTLLFSGGTEFLKAEYGSQSATMGAILRRIDTDGLAADIDSIAGPEFLVAIRDAQPRYEAMVSERLRRDKVTGQNLSETTRGLQAAIVNYATKVAGTIEHDDAATAEAARIALLPIANHRENAGARGQKAAPDAAAPADTSKGPVVPA